LQRLKPALLANPQRASEEKLMAEARAGIFGQVTRFAATGGIVTALGAIAYWVPATYLGVHPLLANFLGYLVAMLSGYVLHSRWSFRGHGSRDDPFRTTSRFFLVSLVSLALNSFWVWLLVGMLDRPTWWPVVTMLFVTPAATFLLNRQWVFR
jgi:putative flippase GtrA